MSELALKLIAEAKRTRATRLDLGNCDLTDLPDELFELTWLEELLLSSHWPMNSLDFKYVFYHNSQNKGKNNRLKSLSPKLCDLKNLKQLIFAGSKNSESSVHDLSPLKDLANLERLDFSQTQVYDLSPLENLVNLKWLDFVQTQASDLSSLKYLVNLERLDFSQTQMSDLSPLIGLVNLQRLNFSQTQVSDLGPLKSLVNLERIEFSQTQVSDLSPLKELSNLQLLNVGFTHVRDLNPLRKSFKLKYLRFHSSSVSDLSPLENLLNLESLWTDCHEIKNLFPIRNLKKLKEIQLFDTSVSDLSPLKDLVNLQILTVSQTEVSDLRPLKGLKNLQELRVSNTQVRDLSPLKDLVNLRIIDISSTLVRDLSPLKKLIENDIIVSLEKYKYEGILIKDSPISNPPKEIIQHGKEAILNYWQQIDEQGGTIPLYEARLIMVGEPGAGKTTLTEKLIDENHQVIPDDKDKKSTLGINIRENWQFNDYKRAGEKFTSHIWDFGGQEIQYMTHQFFLTPESLYVLVADDRKQHTLFPYWFEVIHLLGKDDGGRFSPIVVVLNERNHKSITNFDINEYRLKYPNTRIDVVEVDLADKNLDRFKIVRDKIQHSLCYLDHIGRPMPRMWPRIRQAILNLNDKQNYITGVEFAEICARFGVIRLKDRQLISRHLHRLGVILHFQDDIALRDFIIISPQWALKAVYTILEDKEVIKKNGLFTSVDLDTHWQSLTFEERSKILSLMMKDNFEICYPVGNGNYIAPQLLPRVRPQFKWDNKESLKCHFYYPFMPKGIMTRLIVRKHDVLANDWQLWARGAVFHSFDCDVLVVEEEFDRNGFISIEVNGKQINKVRALNFIRDEIEAIHRKWFSNISYEELAPCNCEYCQKSDKPTFFSWKKLIQRVEENRKTIECDNVRVKDVQVIQLLEGFANVERIRDSLRESVLAEHHGHFNKFSREGEKQENQQQDKNVNIIVNEGAIVNIGNISGRTDSQITGNTVNKIASTPKSKMDAKRPSKRKTIKIFLASSNELVEERRSFELQFGARKRKTFDHDIEVMVWEDFIDAMSQTRLQDEYNRVLKECDIFVMLFFTKVGMYTAEEFETAFGQFKGNGKPLIYAYFKADNVNTGNINRRDLLSLLDFQDKLKELGHFPTHFKDSTDLNFQFSNQLDKLLKEKII